jgi:uncharacterized repeat protein (TIGR02543 family)
MAYSYTYGAYSSTWYPSGSSVARKVRSRLKYELTGPNNRQYTLKFSGEGTLYKDNCTTSITGKLYYQGAQVGSTGTKSYTYSSSHSNNTDVYWPLVAEQTRTIAQKNVSQSITITHIVAHDSNTSKATITFTIPAYTYYTVSYDANGGTDAPASQEKIDGVSLTLSSDIPQKVGYTFQGWATSSDGSVVYTPGASYTTNSNIILYAVWTPNTYQVIYNKNNSAATGTTMDNTTFTYDEPHALSAITYTLTDYYFIGWATSSNGEVVYTNKQSLLNLATSGSITLYAKWKYAYNPPEIQNILAERIDNSGQVSSSGGEQIKVSISVIPGTYTTFNSSTSTTSTNYQYTNLIVKYKLNTASESSYTTLGSTSLSTLQTTPKTVDSLNKGLTFGANNIYNIQVTAQTMSSSSNGTAKATAIGTALVPKAAVILDFDATGKSIGIFTPAIITPPASDPNASTNSHIVILEGDLILNLDNSTATGVDYDLLSAISQSGFNVTI